VFPSASCPVCAARRAAETARKKRWRDGRRPPRLGLLGRRVATQRADCWEEKYGRRRSAAQDPSGHENLIGCRCRGTGRRPARDDVNPARDCRCAKTVSRRRHARMAAPAVAHGIIGFRLVEGAGGCLAAEHEHPPPSTAAAMPLRAVGNGARCSQRPVAGSYASFDAKLRE